MISKPIRTLVACAVSLFVSVAVLCYSAGAFAAEPNDYRVAVGDEIHIVVYANPDLSLTTRISESGAISYPLIGIVNIGGMTITGAEQKIASLLASGGFVKNPQVNISLTQIVGNKVSVLGQVNKPGSYPLLTFNTHVSQIIADAGGIAQTGGDVVTLVGTRDGKAYRKDIDIDDLYMSGQSQNDVLVNGGDAIYIPRAPLFYIYGEVTRPGSYPVTRSMTVMQALAQGGGLTPRGTERSLRLYRRDASGVVRQLDPKASDMVAPGDVIHIGESLF